MKVDFVWQRQLLLMVLHGSALCWHSCLCCHIHPQGLEMEAMPPTTAIKELMLLLLEAIATELILLEGR